MEIYERYVALQKEIDALVSLQDALRTAIAETVPDTGHKDENITVSWTTKATWEYPTTVKALEDNLKQAKKDMQENGQATKVESKILTIRVK